ncbi:MAG: winged helix-turn-helix transcriptional regulator [Candidatus Thorarchaeota archaeon]|nr:winged helix-turn-helix transcriptional regulator [Candidatus Thorarchaeota archaeon]
MRRLLWWLLAGTRGGVNRAKIIKTLNETPFNAHQLAETLALDYKTIRYHLDLLIEHGIIVTRGEGYGRVFFLSNEMEADYNELSEIWEQFGTTSLSKKKEEK